jgi:uncharacterized phage protein gp47/JayE
VAVTEITPAGAKIGTLAEYREAVANRFKAPEFYGANARTSGPGALAQHVDMLGELLSSLAAFLGDVVEQGNPNAAAEAYLEQAVLFNGIEVQQQKYSTVTLQCTAGEEGCTIQAGRVVSDPDTGTKVAVNSEAVLGSSEVALVAATAVEPGPIEIAAGTLTKIDDPVYGWLSVTNPLDAIKGRSKEMPPALRLRQRQAAKGVGGGSAAYIEKVLRNVDNVTDVSVAFTPAKVLQAVVEGGTDADIAAALYRSVGGGTLYEGAVSVVHIDPDVDQTDTVRFYRAVQKPVYLTFVVEKSKGYENVGGDALMKDRVLQYFMGTLSVEGENVPKPRLGETITAAKASLGADGVPYSVVRAVYLGFDAAPSSSEDLSMYYWWRGTTALDKIVILEAP